MKYIMARAIARTATFAAVLLATQAPTVALPVYLECSVKPKVVDSLGSPVNVNIAFDEDSGSFTTDLSVKELFGSDRPLFSAKKIYAIIKRILGDEAYFIDRVNGYILKIDYATMMPCEGSCKVVQTPKRQF